jgi:hypothetical protein
VGNIHLLVKYQNGMSLYKTLPALGWGWGVERICKRRGCFIEGLILGKGKVVAVRGGEEGT